MNIRTWYIVVVYSYVNWINGIRYVSNLLTSYNFMQVEILEMYDGSGSTLDRVLAFRLSAPNHYLEQE